MLTGALMPNSDKVQVSLSKCSISFEKYDEEMFRLIDFEEESKRYPDVNQGDNGAQQLFTECETTRMERGSQVTQAHSRCMYRQSASNELETCEWNGAWSSGGNLSTRSFD